MSNCDWKKLKKEIQQIVSKASEDVKDISEKGQGLGWIWKGHERRALKIANGS